jgi:hypothetical protein
VREKYCWLVVGGWFVLREKYCWLVADKPNEQAAGLQVRRGLGDWVGGRTTGGGGARVILPWVSCAGPQGV